MRFTAFLASSLVAVLLVSGCGGHKGVRGSSGGTTTLSEAGNTAYERAYSDCSSKQLVDLAHEYGAAPNKQAVAVAVGKYWAHRAGGGSDAAQAGEAGCNDGYALAP